MLQLASLCSGSSANSVLIQNEDTAILVDVGASARRTAGALETLGVSPLSLSAVVLTHEHTDHIAGVPVFTRKFDLPIYGSAGTLCAGSIDPARKRTVCAGERFTIGSLELLAVRGRHDAAEPLCYRVACRHTGQSAAIVTDLGLWDDALACCMEGAELAYVESNHDRCMLYDGPYPWYLKQRIASDLGHLSNEDGAALCVRLAQTGTRGFLLGHLSQVNNTPDLAYFTTKQALERTGFCVGGEVALQTAPRLTCSPVFRYGEEQNNQCSLFNCFVSAV